MDGIKHPRNLMCL